MQTAIKYTPYNDLAGKIHQYTDCVKDIVDEKIILESGATALRATSCITQVFTRDRVMVADTPDGLYILHVLARENRSDHVLRATNANELKVISENIHMIAHNSISHTAGKDIEVNAISGNLTHYGKSIVIQAAVGIMSIAKHLLTRGDYQDTRVKALSCMRSGHCIVETDNEMRLSAKHINMG